MATRSAVATDNFNRAGPALGANWSNINNAGGGDVTITASTHVEGGSFGNQAVAIWVGSGSFNADQYSSVVISSGDTGSDSYGFGVVARATVGETDAARDYYYAFKTNTFHFGKCINGTNTEFASFPQSSSWSASDRLELECEGTTIRVMKNGTALGGAFTVTDSALSSGAPGVLGQGDAAGLINGDDWEGGNLVTVTTVQTHHRWRADDGNETTASWLASEDASVSRAVSTNTRLRVLVDTTGDLPSTQFQLEHKLSTDADSTYKKVEVAGGGALAYGTIGSNTTTGTTAPTVAYPASIAAGDILCLAIGNRPNANTPDTPSGWTPSTNYTTTGGTGSEAAGTGTIRVTFFWKVATGSESGSLTLGITSGTSCAAVMWRCTRTTGKDWSVALANGSDNSAGTSVSVTMGSDQGVTSGDLVFVAYVNSEDTATFASEAISQTGVTYGSLNERADFAVTTGNDLRLVIAQHDVSSGTSSAAAVWTATASGTNAANSAGAAVMIRLRQVNQNYQLALSANITASGDNTTAQLTAPAGKSGSDFVTGRMQDDENPADAIDITTDDYSELEWCIAASSIIPNGTYNFRVTLAGTALSTYTVTPAWVIGSAGTVGSGVLRGRFSLPGPVE